MQSAVNWFEIPAVDFSRALAFYSNILDTELEAGDVQGNKMACFPYQPEGVGGAIVAGEHAKPTGGGVMVYLNGGNDLSVVLERVSGAGGSVQMPKTQITEEIGHMATFTDTEGNRVGLHSRG